ncbi:MAG: hypothetical protein FJ137_19135 [Deltaproteobacteria bacterium]|nr:hypothetical protein [Deltaproteobacteria bacterium]
MSSSSTPRERAALVALSIVVVAYGALRAAQGRDGPTALVGDPRWAPPGPFDGGVQRMAPDVAGPCSPGGTAAIDDCADRLMARQRHAAAVDAPGADRARPLPWSRPAVLLGDERGLAVVYVAGEGLLRLTPEAVARAGRDGPAR